MNPKHQAAVIEYIDNEDQLGQRVEPSEVIDVLRALDDTPRDEHELEKLAEQILSDLLDAEVISGWPDGSDGIVFGMTPLEP